jgi:hypothetical protein
VQRNRQLWSQHLGGSMDVSNIFFAPLIDLDESNGPSLIQQYLLDHSGMDMSFALENWIQLNH